MNTATVRLSGVSKVSLALTFALSAGAPARADDNRHQVSPFYGSFSHTIPIEVPPFHGVEPKLALSYSSEGRNGLLGVGWSLAGISTIERVNGGRGTPTWEATDTYLLDGQELVACVAGMVSPSCTTGGSHATKNESYLKIRFDSPTNTWTVWAKDGTRTTFSPTFITAGYTFRWGQASVIDTFGNTVSYNWASSGGDRYPSTVTYNGYSITFYREPRPDPMSFGAAYEMGWTQDRFKSIFVSLGATPIRAYKLSYSTSAVTSRSLLTAVQQFGKDVAHTSGTITGGTSLPPQTFAYQNDFLGRSFQSTSAPPATPPNTQEPVTWARRVNAYAVGANGSSLTKVYGGSSEFNAGASSTRAITSGDGYMEYTFQSGAWAMIGLSSGDTNTGYPDIDFALYSNGGNVLYIYENGSFMGGGWGLANGDTLRVEVTNGTVKYRKNSALLYTSTKTPTYPMLVDTSLGSMGSTLANVNISGALIDESHWCGGNNFKTGDFNGDGRTDQFCYGPAGLTRVRLATASGFAEPTTWQSQSIFNSIYLADFNGDGKTDILDFGAPNAAVSLSTGSSFGPNTPWGYADGYRPDNGWHVACYGSPTVADFNGDGKSDVLCGELDTNNVFVGISSGASFSFGVWALHWCDGQRSAADFDGDGKDDYVCVSSSTWQLSTKLSTGSAFALGGPYIAGTFCAIGDHVITDLNGDGKADLSCRGNGKVALSTGRVVIEQGTYGGWCSGGEVFGADADGDGEGDVICNNPASGVTDIQVRQWTGSTLAAAETWKASWCNGSVRAGDYNGDGKMDLLCDSLATPVALGGTNDFKSDLVSTVSNGIGGSTQLQYGVSTDFPNNSGSPPPKFVVSSLTIGDGRGAFATTTYTYAGARFDRQERLFLGFEYSRRTLPCIGTETVCPYEEGYLHQDLAALGNPSWITRRDGAGTLLKATHFEYETNGATVPRKAPLSGQWDYFYGSGVGGSCTLPCSFAKRTYTTHQYDLYGNATLATRHGDYDSTGDELTIEWTYVPNTSLYIVGRPSGETRSAGGVLRAASEYWYDGATSQLAPNRGALTTERSWLDSESRWVARHATFDLFGNTVQTVDEVGNTAVTLFDVSYHLFPVTVTNGAGESTSSSWDAACTRASQQTDPNGQITSWQTDALCRLIRTDAPLGSFETRSYLATGTASQHIRIERPPATPGGPNSFALDYYDGFRRRYLLVSPGASSSETIRIEQAYDARGSLAYRSAPYLNGATPRYETYSYDTLDRLRKTQFGDGSEELIAHGPWSVITTDPHGHASTTRFNSEGRTLSDEQQLNGQAIQTTYAYDPLGRLIRRTDPASNVWTWEFDSLGRNIVRNDPNAGLWTFEFDDAGRPSAHVDARGVRTTYTHDGAGRVTARSTPDGTVSFSYGDVRPGYFNNGRLSSISSVTSVLRYDYDAAGRRVRAISVIDGVEYAMQWRHDTAGRLAGITYPDGQTIGTEANPFVYDDGGRVKSIPGIVATTSYDAAGRPLTQVNENGTTITRSYSADRGWLTAISSIGPGGQIQQLGYAIDQGGLATGMSSTVADQNWSYAFDELHRLTSATSPTSPSDNQSFAYDSVGNVTLNSRIGVYNYPTPGSVRPNAPLTAGTGNYTYDANGNMQTSPTQNLAWNAENVLAQSGATQFYYDGLGRRVKKVVSGQTSVYPFGDDYEVSNGSATRYLRVEKVGVVAKRVSGQTYWMHTDRLGSVDAVTDSSGTVVHRRSYRPYGQEIGGGTGHLETRSYLGAIKDEEASLVYLHARHYDPKLAIFVSPDPLDASCWGKGEGAFAYSGGDPINNSDWNGLADCEEKDREGKCVFRVEIALPGPQPVPRPAPGTPGSPGSGGSSTGGSGPTRPPGDRNGPGDRRPPTTPGGDPPPPEEWSGPIEAGPSPTGSTPPQFPLKFEETVIVEGQAPKREFGDIAPFDMGNSVTATSRINREVRESPFIGWRVRPALCARLLGEHYAAEIECNQQIATCGGHARCLALFASCIRAHRTARRYEALGCGHVVFGGP